ncbi:hypothetical protein DUI87_00557 [Hirundo rustica rustica]|uniref:Uncharacterized protein n=1 Tax=Hirundo rustica rustica TaxID=333673 RepID=A0A3M0LB41_HIRRU|nr:hypothetical protein DUI87_00557 [Hirundo rustica rustica]
MDVDVAAFISTLEAAALLVGVPSQELLGRELLDLDLDLLQLLELLELELATGLLFSSLTGPEHSSLWASSLHWPTRTLLMLWISGTCVLTEERLQHLHQHLHIWTIEAEAVQDAALYVLNLLPPVAVYSLQPLEQPGLHGVQEMLLLTKSKFTIEKDWLDRSCLIHQEWVRYFSGDQYLIRI